MLQLTLMCKTKVFATFNTEKKKRTEKSYSLALALTLTLTIWLQGTADDGDALHCL